MIPHRHRNLNVLVVGVIACLGGVAIGGCNVVLDNEPGQLRSDRDSNRPTEQMTGDAPDAGSTPIVPSAPSEPSDAGAQPDPEATCAPGHTWCQGICVDDNDPNYGCGSCTPCRGKHGTATCQNHVCVMSACDPGYAECNGKGDDGCEVDLSKPATCGGCTTACTAPNPICVPEATSFKCGNGCPVTAPTRCDNTCVDTATNVSNCGACGTKCLDVDHADVSCVLSQCRFTCKVGYHLCGNKCVLDTDATACGAACTVCPTVPNAVATCQLGACGVTCSPGFNDCNTSAVDGCESNSATDPLNCGACGHSCNGGTCSGGVCSPPPPPPDAGP